MIEEAIIEEPQEIAPPPAVYHFDAETGIYSGQGIADESPLEPGAWLVPRNATLIEPPAEVPEGFAPFWRRGAWAVEAVPEVDADLDGRQDAPQGFEPEPERPGYFRRIVAALLGR